MDNPLNFYPFLSEIPEKVISSIDLDALYIPTLSEQNRLADLSLKLDKNVVVYKKDYICKGAHLCRILQPAGLTSTQLDLLNLMEKDFSGGQIVVAYENPLTLII